MKRLLLILMTCVLFLSSISFASAATSVNEFVPVEQYEETYDEDGITIVEELTVYQLARSTQRTVRKTRTYKKNDTTIAIIAVTAVFSYNGSTVSVSSKKVSQSDTYEGWKYSQTSFTSSGGTVTLSGKLTKLLNSTVPVSVTITCDANGNIT
jgi:hypothetical protein